MLETLRSPFGLILISPLLSWPLLKICALDLVENVVLIDPLRDSAGRDKDMALDSDEQWENSWFNVISDLKLQ